MNRISAIVNGKRAITVDTAMRLARYFGTSPQYWLNLQLAFDPEVADREIRSNSNSCHPVRSISRVTLCTLDRMPLSKS